MIASPVSARPRQSSSDVNTAILFGATVTRNAVTRSNIQTQQVYDRLDVEVAAKERALSRLNISERERRKLLVEIADLRRQQGELIRELERKDHEYAAAIRAYREGLTGLSESKDPEIAENLERYAQGDVNALDRIQAIIDIERAASEAGLRARNGDKQRGLAFLVEDARDKGQKSSGEVLAAWRKTTEIEPEEARNWIEVCRLQIEIGKIAEAAESASRAKAAARTPEEVSLSLDALGEIAQIEGRLGDAERLRAEGLQIAHALLSTSPGNVQHRRGLSVMLLKTGDIADLLGKKADAELAYQEALTLRRQLQAEYPTAQGPYRDLGVILSRLAKSKLRGGETADARRYVDEALHIFNRLKVMNPGRSAPHWDEAIALRLAGDIAVLGGRGDAALASYEEAVVIYLELWKRDRLNERFRSELSRTFEPLLWNLIQDGQLERALRLANDYVAQARRALSDTPDHGLAKSRLGTALFYRAQALQQLGRTGARATYQESIAVFEAMDRDQPLNIEARRMLDLIRQLSAGAI